MYLRLSILKIQRYVIRDGYPTFVNNRRRQNSPMTRRISFRSCVYTNQLRKYTRATLLSHTESRRNPQAGILIDRLTNLNGLPRRGYSNPHLPIESWALSSRISMNQRAGTRRWCQSLLSWLTRLASPSSLAHTGRSFLGLAFFRV